jgi:ectoine hydroxylase-related dioxygenase (phytanoyl-CoA dioxygenase family)
VRIDIEGYEIGFDPFLENKQLLEHFINYGYVVVSRVIEFEQVNLIKKRLNYLIQNYGDSLDSNGVSIISRGFMEVYHDSSLALIRESPRFYEAHRIIWNNPQLWVTFDRFVVKQPNSMGLPLHLDQNPYLQPSFECTQGLVAIENNNPECGSTVLVPSSHIDFDSVKTLFNKTENYNPIPTDSNYYHSIINCRYNIKLRDGDGLIWDSRLIHGNSDNCSNLTRLAALVSYQPATDNQSRLKRVDAMLNCEAANDRNARMHASIRPRFTDAAFMKQLQEDYTLSELGQLVYGIKEYQ